MKAIVIEVPGLHLGYLGCYGNDWVDTPNLDRLAAEGVVFDQHYADCPEALAPGRWTGQYSFPLPDPATPTLDDLADQLGRLFTLEQLLKDAGIALRRIGAPSQFGVPADHGLVSATAIMQEASRSLRALSSQENWLMQVDFPVLAPPWQIVEENLEPYFTDQAETNEEASDPDPDAQTLTPWLDAPPGPVNLDDRCWQRLQNTYAAVVTHLDAQLGDLLAKFDRRGLREEALLIVTLHRGLALGEHGILGDCRPWLHDELIHLPLIVRLPGKAEAGRRVAALTQPVDLLPTLLAVFGAMPQAEMHGHDLAPLMRGHVAKLRDYACAGLRQGERIEWALRTLEWGLIVPVRQAVNDPPRPVQLYVKPDDRWEVNDLRTRHLEYAEQLEQTLRAFVEATRVPGPLRPPHLPEQ